MSDLVSIEVVGTELEAEMICSLLRTAGIRCFHRATNAGAADGMPFGGPRAILVREEDRTTALEVVRSGQR
jgi:hypothetical protein